MKEATSKLVYSSECGRICPHCGRPVKDCHCLRPAPALQPDDGVVRVGRQTKGRKGKGVTLISGVPLRGEDLKTLARELKQACGVGGTLKGTLLELQGDCRDQVLPLLKAKGWPVKLVGG